MEMTQDETNGNGLASPIGLAKQAYQGAPHGVAQVSLSNPELKVKQYRWELKTKRQRRQETIDSL